MEYNTNRGLLLMREYGRHIQSMVNYMLTIDDRSVRLKNAEAIVDLMAFFNPHLKLAEDYKHMLWDHLHVMSDFKLDVDAPYPVPDRETYKSRPKPLAYPKRKPKYNHLGKNLELVIGKAMAETDPEKKSGFAHAIAHYMKLAYSTWHKELIHDDAIRQELNNITKGDLEFTNTPFVRHRATPFRDEDAYPPAKRKFKPNNRNPNNRNPNNRNVQPGNGTPSGGGNRNPGPAAGGRNPAKFGKKRY
jgi:hypothetical protein